MTKAGGGWPARFGTLRWDSVLSATNFKREGQSKTAVTLSPEYSTSYPDNGESGQSYDEEMTELETMGKDGFRTRALCPICGATRQARTEMFVTAE